jgi:hypothetical protein
LLHQWGSCGVGLVGHVVVLLVVIAPRERAGDGRILPGTCVPLLLGLRRSPSIDQKRIDRERSALTQREERSTLGRFPISTTSR